MSSDQGLPAAAQASSTALFFDTTFLIWGYLGHVIGSRTTGRCPSFVNIALLQHHFSNLGLPRPCHRHKDYRPLPKLRQQRSHSSTIPSLGLLLLLPRPHNPAVHQATTFKGRGYLLRAVSKHPCWFSAIVTERLQLSISRDVIMPSIKPQPPKAVATYHGPCPSTLAGCQQ
jgi:hypothetical protein